jgi:hypothetical protein
MTSVGASPAQANGHYIALGSVQLKAYTAGTGSGASWRQGTFADDAALAPFPAYTLFKDMGKTEVSSLRMFRLVAPVVSGQNTNPYGASGTGNSFGVSTTVGSNAVVGYVELGYEGFGGADPVARFNAM